MCDYANEARLKQAAQQQYANAAAPDVQGMEGYGRSQRPTPLEEMMMTEENLRQDAEKRREGIQFLSENPAFNQFIALIRKGAIGIVALCVLTLAGCSDWERTTFQTLSASNVTINNAQAAYEARTLPHNQCVYDVVNKAKAAQTLAVDGMLAYEAAKGTSAATGAENAVTAELAQLAPILASVQTLGTSTCGGGK